MTPFFVIGCARGAAFKQSRPVRATVFPTFGKQTSVLSQKPNFICRRANVWSRKRPIQAFFVSAFAVFGFSVRLGGWDFTAIEVAGESYAGWPRILSACPQTPAL